MIKSRDSKEIRLKEFSYALGRMETSYEKSTIN